MQEDSIAGAPGSGQPTDLQQLEAALAAGVISPELFATLRTQLSPPPAVPPPPAAPPADELPSLLSMLDRSLVPATPVIASPLPVAAAAAATEPAAAEDTGPVPPAADAIRQQIEAQLTRLRQPAPPVPPPVLTAAAAPVPPPAPPMPPPVFQPALPAAPAPAPATSNRLPAGLLILAGLVLLGLLAYVFLRPVPGSEALTSASLRLAADTASLAAPIITPPATPAASPVAKPKAVQAIPETVWVAASGPTLAPDSVQRPATKLANVAAAAPPAAAAAPPNELVVSPPVGTAAPVPAAPETSDDAATTKVREVLAAYYADLFAPPLHASQYFAPQVERLYIHHNLTPATIDAELARSFFPDNQQAVYQVEPGTLHVSQPAADGTRTATFTESVRLYRVSHQKFQRLRTQVLAKLNADYQITYFRQEKLLANEFE